MQTNRGIATGALATAVLNVSHPTGSEPEAEGPRPAHHLNDTKNSFCNPWASFRSINLAKTTLTLLPNMLINSPSVPKDVETQLKKQIPTWGLDATNNLSENPRQIKATWLGHACFLLELPTPEGAIRGARILYDPVFSNRCSPFSFAGPARYSDPPCKMSDLPPIDIVVISHNHYDHLDTESIKTLEKAHAPHFFAPLGNGDYFACLDVPKERTHILDWWEGREVSLGLPVPSKFVITCTPCQHFTGRGILDRFKSLWASWAIEDLTPSPQPGVKIWFSGDTGYRAVSLEEDRDPAIRDSLPVCPEFKKIGEKFGGFDLAFIAIGAYNPRDFMSPVHCAPVDSVRVFQDVKAKRAIGMHWGTWVLTVEPVMEPPALLAEECKKAGIPDGVFDVCGLGETVLV